MIGWLFGSPISSRELRSVVSDLNKRRLVTDNNSDTRNNSNKAPECHRDRFPSPASRSARLVNTGFRLRGVSGHITSFPAQSYSANSRDSHHVGTAIDPPPESTRCIENPTEILLYSSAFNWRFLSSGAPSQVADGRQSDAMKVRIFATRRIEAMELRRLDEMYSRDLRHSIGRQ